MEKKCEHCGNLFQARRSINRFCSTSCSANWRVLNHPLPDSCFKKGDESWNKGKNISGMSGKKHSEETIKKMSESARLLMPNPKTTQSHRERRTSKYKLWRSNVLSRDQYRCVLCGCSEKLEVDHILPFELHVEKRYDIQNGRTLCKPCHLKTDSHGASVEKQSRLQSEVKNGNEEKAAS